jgi:hypothetical protein
MPIGEALSLPLPQQVSGSAAVTGLERQPRPYRRILCHRHSLVATADLSAAISSAEGDNFSDFVPRQHPPSRPDDDVAHHALVGAHFGTHLEASRRGRGFSNSLGFRATWSASLRLMPSVSSVNAFFSSSLHRRSPRQPLMTASRSALGESRSRSMGSA